MIPKIIHYCWFGGKAKPELYYKCKKSWEKCCPDYQIIEWNEDNFDVSLCPLYVRQAYELEKWAFVTDYVRLQIIYKFGGIYLDTDVELKKTLDSLLNFKAFFAIESGGEIATGLGFGAENGNTLIWDLMKDYLSIPFILENGQFDRTGCPLRNLHVFIDYGFNNRDVYQIIGDQVCIMPTEFFCPINYYTGERKITKNTIGIHWYAASWQSEEGRKRHKKQMRQQRFQRIRYLPNQILCSVLGVELYNKIKKRIK